MIYQFKVRLVDLGLRANSNLLKKKKYTIKVFPSSFMTIAVLRLIGNIF